MNRTPSSQPARPDDPSEPRLGPDWRERLAITADYILIGILMLAACAPVLTAGSALATGSAAMVARRERGTFPPLRELGRTFLRGLPSGLVATLVGLVVAALLTVDLLLVGRGVVPGGPVLVAFGALVATQAVGYTMLVLVRIGVRGGTGWRPSVRWASAAFARSPLTPTLLALIVALGVGASLLFLPLVPEMLGLALAGAHVVVRRSLPDLDV